MTSLFMRLKVIFFFFFITLTGVVYSQTNVVTQHFDNQRTGWYNNETVLTNRNVKPGSFGKLFTRSVDDQFYAQPLVMGVNLPSIGQRNIVIAATVNNSIYAYDADSANITQPYWQVNLTPSGSRAPKNTDMTGACGGGYRDFSGNMGIVGTPVIDPATMTLYVVARSVNSSNVYAQYLHALDVTTGQEKSNSPVKITALITASGDGSSNGSMTFDPQKQNQRPALLLTDNTVYITWASHCDWSPYHGWVIGYDATTLQQVKIYNTTPEGYNGGIWMCGSGPSVDENGNIYLAVGNGSAGKNGIVSDVTNRSESALKLTPTTGLSMTVSSFFTPKNYSQLEAGDLDFGITQMMLIPNTNRVVTGCKDGKLYLLNRDTMGGFDINNNHVLQPIDLGTNATMHSNLSYYKGAQKEWVYTWSENSLLKAFNYDRTTNLFNLANTISSPAQGPVGYSGAFHSVSSNGSIDSTAILWVTHAANGDANQSVRPGILRAFNANDVTKEIWNSSAYPSDSPGNYAKFNAPVIANGKVYLGSFSNQLIVYGLLKNTNTSCNSSNIGLNKTGVASSVGSGSVANVFDGNVSTVWKSAASDNQWISVDLGQRYDVCKISIQWSTQLGVDFSIQISDDNQNWNSMVSVTGNSFSSSEYPVNGSGRFVRMYGTKGSSGYSISEFQVNGTLSASQCAPPSLLPATNIYDNSATVNWSSIGTNFVLEYKTVSAGNWNQMITSSTSSSLNALACATDFLYRIKNVCSANDSSAYVNGAFSTNVCDPNCGKLLTRWSTVDIGDVQSAGETCYSNGTFTLRGSGDDIWNTQDAFRFAYKTFVGDGEMYGRVVSMDNTNPWNKCGVMFRESLTAGSRHAFIALTSGNGVAFQNRLVTDDVSYNASTGSGTVAPYWVKLTKKGSVYTGYASTDSVNWVQVGNAVDAGFGNGTPVYAGFALTSHNNGVLSTAVIDNMFITGSFLYDLQSLEATLNINKTVNVEWTTTLEGSIQRFVLQRKTTSDYVNIDTVAANNSGNFTIKYSQKDSLLYTGLVTYRLVMVSLDNIIRYSPPVSVFISSKVPPSVYPNPAPGPSSQVFSVARGELKEPIRFVNIYDLHGRQITQVNNANAVGIVEINISGIPNGIYIIEIITSLSKYKTKLLIKN